MARPFHPIFVVPLLAFTLAGCGGRRADWPGLAPRAGEVTTMVPRNVVGGGRCAAAADCAPPVAAAPAAAPDVPPPVPVPTLAEAQAELAAIDGVIDAVAAAAGPARAALATAQRAATGSADDSAASGRAEAAQSSLAAALAPLVGAAFRLQALDLGTSTAADRASYSDRLAELAGRIAILQDQ
jgi:hypothetical protein